RSAIVSGHYPPGAKLPSETALAGEFGVARGTLRRALSILATEGKVVSRQGARSRVAEFVLQYRLSPTSKISGQVKLLVRHTERKVLSVETTAPALAIRQLLQWPRGRRVTRLDTVREIEGKPLAFIEHYLPLPQFDGIGKIVAETGSVTTAFKHYGVNS